MDWSMHDSPELSVSTPNIVYTTNLYGYTTGCPVSFRVDGRRGTFRVDVSELTGWTAIDGGEGFATSAEAKVFADKWLAAAKSQATLNPRVSR